MNLNIKSTLTLVLIVFCTISTLFSQTHFFNGSWEELMEKAEQENKPIFVDLYFTGCFPCKKMDESVFPSKEVASHLNENYINYKINVFEDEIGPKINMKYAISGFPSFLFLTPDGRVIDIDSGYLSIKDLIETSNEVLRKYNANKIKSFDPSLDLVYPEFYKNMYAVSSSSPSFEKIDEFLKSQPSLSEEVSFVVLTRLGAPRSYADFYIDNCVELANKYSRKIVANALRRPVGIKIIEYGKENDTIKFNKLLSKIKPVYKTKEWEVFSKNTYYPNFYKESENANWYISTIKKSEFFDWQDMSNALAAIIVDNHQNKAVLKRINDLFLAKQNDWHSSGDFYKAALIAYYLEDYNSAKKWLTAIHEAPVKSSLSKETINNLGKAITSKKQGFIDESPVIDIKGFNLD